MHTGASCGAAAAGQLSIRGHPSSAVEDLLDTLNLRSRSGHTPLTQ